ncbi:transporter [Nitrogeniibacter mangrovi]|uniref:Transporter n=1 Tax=Nitrogeniibacter mangrovi TaxID=2016596 RepID=A0A6C1B9H8_9RHOO|nr:TOBE domain-containing protein [Nitrogeniibacter mangrovi]QID19495.1 transporter [Nitrogeniibacter mangrovi]
MKISARNQFDGHVQALTRGPVNTEVVVDTREGDRLVAVVTTASVDALGLGDGTPVLAIVKAPWVVLARDDAALPDGPGLATGFSARNRLYGVVEQIEAGRVNTEVVLALPGGTQVCAVVSREAALALGLTPGMPACALIKASHVLLARLEG